MMYYLLISYMSITNEQTLFCLVVERLNCILKMLFEVLQRCLHAEKKIDKPAQIQALDGTVKKQVKYLIETES